MNEPEDVTHKTHQRFCHSCQQWLDVAGRNWTAWVENRSAVALQLLSAQGRYWPGTAVGVRLASSRWGGLSVVRLCAAGDNSLFRPTSGRSFRSFDAPCVSSGPRNPPW